MEEWQIKALEYLLLDYNVWADNAVDVGVFKTIEEALTNKALKCAARMISACESIHGKIDPTKTIAEKVMIAFAMPDYKNRKQREDGSSR